MELSTEQAQGCLRLEPIRCRCRKGGLVLNVVLMNGGCVLLYDDWFVWNGTGLYWCFFIIFSFCLGWCFSFYIDVPVFSSVLRIFSFYVMTFISDLLFCFSQF